MSFRHDRRRRVLTDDHSSGSGAAISPAAVGETSKPAKEAYSAAARRDQQPHVTDLVPLSWLALALPLLAALAVIAGLESAYHWLPDLTAAVGAEGLGALDLTSPASVAHWYSAGMLGLVAMLSVLVYRLRSHRIDDYRGRYRMWRWVVPAALLLSVNETARLDLLGEHLLNLSLRGSSFAPAWLWSVGCAVVWGLLAVRLIVEVRHSLLASSAVLLAAGDLLAVATVHLWSPWDLSAARAVMLLGGLRMVGHLLLLTGGTLYARHVILDAEGRLKQRARKASGPAKRKRRPAADADAESADGKKGSKLAVDPPHKTPGPPTSRTDLESAQRPTAARATTTTRQEPTPDRKVASTSSPQRPEAADDDDDDDASDNPGMTRAERKRLKRQQRQG